MRLQFSIQPIIIGLFISKVAYFQGKGMDVLVIHITNCSVIEVADVSIEENDLIIDNEGAAHSG